MDVKGFYPYLNELVNDVFKFKSDHIKVAQEILNKMNPNQRKSLGALSEKVLKCDKFG